MVFVPLRLCCLRLCLLLCLPHFPSLSWAGQHARTGRADGDICSGAARFPPDIPCGHQPGPALVSGKPVCRSAVLHHSVSGACLLAWASAEMWRNRRLSWQADLPLRRSPRTSFPQRGWGLALQTRGSAAVFLGQAAVFRAAALAAEARRGHAVRQLVHALLLYLHRRKLSSNASVADSWHDDM